MDFSESYRCSGGGGSKEGGGQSQECAPCYSPNGLYLATAVEYRLIIREVETLRVVQLYACLDRIDRLEWADNSLYVLCGLYARSIIQVWAVDQPDWTCKIDEGPAGIARTLWAPDGLSLVCIASFQIRTTIWSLVDKKCTYLRGSKHANKGLAFSPDGRLLAILERYDYKDHIALYDVHSWKEVLHITCDTSDAVDLRWSPDGTYIAVWDSVLTYRVQVFTLEGTLATTYSAYQDALGVKDVSWNASGELLSVGSFDERARVLNHVTWQPLLECTHPKQITDPQHVVVYFEMEELAPVHGSPLKSPRSREVKSKYMIKDLPVSIPTSQPPLDVPFPKLGVGQQHWSFDSQYLLTVNENQPSTVWIWDMAAMELSSVLSHSSSILEAKWAPNSCTLVMVAGNGRIYMWTPAGASIIHIPLKNFAARSLVWSPNGQNFTLTDSDAFCCAYFVPEEQA
mmetsp:Transcript_25008/g.64551  ORF Transcript_25008/g.64551 Transcript_25008/m.64551 type:complete len:456 (+) Transcript_25008:2492-3859(+)|eukprot:CAMPEP_0202337688 /NCGR_PEP_ID=MMETSP1126-20121109/274_1 /ASSEMBLY_ACC=CAM_ASM_000457 /TAXON_ID=3047 /ORGANISM="Dunaliella tertiolecta, Strain CCMP1320" /LENGTH=455 /DNA_ID=CAMNT_0048927937 /DNA_START=69 /DNA_END=1436 /DNA_ORIENTATION=-